MWREEPYDAALHISAYSVEWPPVHSPKSSRSRTTTKFGLLIFEFYLEPVEKGQNAVSVGSHRPQAIRNTQI